MAYCNFNILFLSILYTDAILGNAELVNSLLKEAKELDLKEVLVLTYQKDFFIKCGFKEILKTKIPNHKVWEDCIKCKLFPTCNEIAMIIKLHSLDG